MAESQASESIDTSINQCLWIYNLSYFLLDIRFSIVFILDLKAWSKHRFDVKRHRMRGMWPYFSNMYSSSSKICGPTSQICPGSQILCRCLDYFSSQICSGTRLFRHCIDLLYKLTSWMHPALLLKISWGTLTLSVPQQRYCTISGWKVSFSSGTDKQMLMKCFFFVNCDKATKWSFSKAEDERRCKDGKMECRIQ